MNWLRNFMYGRYGLDQLSIALFVCYLLVWMIERLTNFRYLAIVTGLLILLILLRALSRNTAKRAAENQVFLRFWGKIKRFFGGRSRNVPTWQSTDYRYQAQVQQKEAERAAKRAARQRQKDERANFRRFECPNCSQTLRVPRGKGKIRIHCPKCGTDFVKKT